MTPRPLGLLAELTHRCPLRCPYCSNPTTLAREELPTADWVRALHEAAELGVIHVFFSGGEPLLRADLPELVAAAHDAGLYTNLITSAFGLTRPVLERLKANGLDSVQISFQADEAELANAIAGANAHQRKLEAAALVLDLGLPLTVNTVLHRGNIDRMPQLIALAERVGAQRLELANVQFYGWAYGNREGLLPTRIQVDRAASIAQAAQERLRGKVEVVYVLPDYYGDRPKPCMQGWGQRHLTIDPSGQVLPCPTASCIPGLHFDNLRQQPLAWVGSSRVDLQACKLEYSIVSPK